MNSSELVTIVAEDALDRVDETSLRSRAKIQPTVLIQ
jgi:hypothetical protein